MSDKIYRTDLSALMRSESFSEASREELRALLALLANGGKADTDTLVTLAGVSRPRLSSALALWEGSGVIHPEDGTLTEEFEERILGESFMEEGSAEVAANIRDEGLRELIEECSSLMHRPSLSTQEIKWLSATVTQLALTPEYVLTLAAHLADKAKLTVPALKNKAERLTNMGIDTLEELERYITDRADECAEDWEYRHLLGIYNRALTKYEKTMFRRWGKEYGYSVNIVGEAYDLCVANTGKLNLAYMNKVLTAWRDAGCKTVEECRAKIEEERTAKKADTPAYSRKKAHPESETPKYADFDTEDALMRALKRSYGGTDGGTDPSGGGSEQ